MALLDAALAPGTSFDGMPFDCMPLEGTPHESTSFEHRRADHAPHTCLPGRDGHRVLAIAGPQGSGKTTLAAQVAAEARRRGLRVATLSLDDVYLGRRARAQLARAVHPLFARRGPPGTHDIALACETLDALATGRTIRLPRFDKLRDRRLPPSRWPQTGPVDLTVIEGWCLQVPPELPPALREPINALEREEDPDGSWRAACNTALACDYPALWSRLPPPVWLQPPGFACIPRWRWQQEQAMAAARPRVAAHAMTRPEVEHFVQLFERITRHAMRTMPARAGIVLRLDGARRVVGTGVRTGVGADVMSPAPAAARRDGAARPQAPTPRRNSPSG